MFKTKDSLLIDADRLAHKLLSRDSGVYKKIKRAFGKKILKSDGEISRASLGNIVFAGRKELARLNRIIHPALIKEIKRLIKGSNKRLIILDAALIIEAGLSKSVDILIVVTAKKDQQILRKQKSSQFTKKQVLKRLKSQISQNKKLRFADFTIDNSSSMSETRKQVSEIRRKLWKS